MPTLMPPAPPPPQGPLQKPKASQDEILKALKWLCATFPAVFNLADRKPLKSNIRQDIIARNIKGAPLQEFIDDALNRYKNHIWYQRNLLEYNQCYDLEGKEAGEVTAEKRNKARAILKQLNQKSLGKTAQRNKLNNEKLDRWGGALRYLYTTYPAVFHAKNKKPLKIGILDDIVSALMPNHPSKAHIQKAVCYYVGDIWYQKVIVEQDVRYDLFGKEVGEVTVDQKAHAAKLIAQIEKRMEANKKGQKTP
jgi:sRNA-binding protein